MERNDREEEEEKKRERELQTKMTGGKTKVREKDKN